MTANSPEALEMHTDVVKSKIMNLLIKHFCKDRQ